MAENLKTQIAALQAALLKDHQDLDSLAAELLEAYEEINLFYELSEVFEPAETERQLSEILLKRAMEAGTGQGGAVILTHPQGDDPPLEMVVGQTSLSLAASAALAAGKSRIAGESAIDNSTRRLPAIQISLDRGVACNVSPETEPDCGFDRPTIVTPILIKHIPAGALIVQKNAGAFGSGEMKHIQVLAAEAGVFLNSLRQTRRLIAAAQLNKQVELAETIQRQLLPSAQIGVEGLDIAGAYIATEQVGGDYYDVIAGEGGRITALVADVSGHSIPSSLIMTSARTAVRLLSQSESRPAEVLRQLNENLYRDLDQTGLFLSIFLATIDPASRSLQYASAGHNPAFLHRKGARRVQKLDATGLLTGVAPDAAYTEVSLKLERGDALVLYTDGITEARGVGDDFFGEGRLEALVLKHAGAGARTVVDAIVANVERYAGKRLADDITLLVVKIPDAMALA